jgi:hypothetical protein
MEFVTKPIHQSSSCDDEKLYGMEYRISNGYPADKQGGKHITQRLRENRFLNLSCILIV